MLPYLSQTCLIMHTLLIKLVLNHHKCMLCMLDHTDWLETGWEFYLGKTTVNQITSNLEHCFDLHMLGTHQVLEGNDCQMIPHLHGIQKGSESLIVQRFWMGVEGCLLLIPSWNMHDTNIELSSYLKEKKGIIKKLLSKDTMLLSQSPLKF